MLGDAPSLRGAWISGYCSATAMNKHTLRLDTDHHVAVMLQQAVDRIGNNALSVRMADKQIVLTGHASTWHQKQMAQESVRKLAANRTIQNRIQVTGNKAS